MSAAAARKELVRCAGTQFDLEIVQLFERVARTQMGGRTLAWLAEIPGLQLAGAATTTAVPTIMTSTMTAVSSAALVVAATVSNAPPETLSMVEFAPVTQAPLIVEETTTTTVLWIDEASVSTPSTTTGRRRHHHRCRHRQPRRPRLRPSRRW
ncbi:MAG: hypothetical protein R2706_19830 [Acidimicrobiales bacterium]